ncbi:tRNA pseudouridine(13) synthase TruD [Thiotrichales bacterium 19S11-10]|nr:tRNA pseudouridine(13) synthase TruD [Thiotrichales bacterium 19S11-10]
MSEKTAIGALKSYTTDFIVEEKLNISFSEKGEHLWVYIEKENRHTEEVAKLLARFTGISLRDVGYSGMKDKQALTKQWFSLKLPIQYQPDWSLFSYEGIKILESIRHDKKLRLKTHQANAFEIIIRDVDVDQVKLASAIHYIKYKGVPNFYGSQRFGHNHKNLDDLFLWLKGETNPPLKRKKWLLSVYRSYLFNHYLNYRYSLGKLYQVLPGDVLTFNGSDSVFQVNLEEEVLAAQKRLKASEVFPAGPLWSAEEAKLFWQSEALKLLNQAFETEKAWLDPKVIRPFKLKLAYRSLVLMPKNLQADYDLNKNQLRLQFLLPAGGYATTLIDYLSKLVA